jgi:hypothetical protein
MTDEAQAPMAVPMPGAEVEIEPEVPTVDVGQTLADLQAAGIQVQANPDGTVVLTGVPPEALAQLGAGEAPPAPA